MSKLDKSNPHYYKKQIEKLINEAINNGITIGYEITSNADKVNKIEIWMMNNTGEFASAITYDSKIMEVN